MVTGVAIFGFAIGVFAFTLHAVGQDSFDDVIVPDAPAAKQSPKTPTAQANGMRS
ncbi:hypothetical protein H2204_007201 [Knufia peltigerae]|nr:hypothetical protein H2204_007201 [Knufia peltigerae]